MRYTIRFRYKDRRNDDWTYGMDTMDSVDELISFYGLRMCYDYEILDCYRVQ